MGTLQLMYGDSAHQLLCLGRLVAVMSPRGLHTSIVERIPEDVHGYLADKKHTLPRTLQLDYTKGHMVVLGVRLFLMSERGTPIHVLALIQVRSWWRVVPVKCTDAEGCIHHVCWRGGVSLSSELTWRGVPIKWADMEGCPYQVC